MMVLGAISGSEEAAKVADQLFPDPVVTASLYCAGRLDSITPAPAGRAAEGR